jgi:hypothetical protein
MPDSLELALFDSGSKAHVLGVARCGDDYAFERIALADLAGLHAFRDRITQSLLGKASRPTSQELRKFGDDLYRFFLQGELLELYARLPAEHMRIQVLSNQAEIQAIPWEYWQEPKKPGPRRERSVVRIVPTIGIGAPQPLSLAQEVRVLFVSAAPVDQGGVSWAEVKEVLEDAFAARLPDRFDLEAIEGVSRASLSQALMQRNFDIFHFSGHGELVGGHGHLVLIDPQTRKSTRLRADELASILSGRGVRLVVLSACETSSGNAGEPFAVIADALVRSGIPAVIANQFPVPDKTVATFVGAVYTSLLTTGDIDQAVTEGRLQLAIELDGTAGAPLEWGIPTLHRHAGAARLFKP